MSRLQAWFDRYNEARKAKSERGKRGIKHGIAKVAFQSGKMKGYYVGSSVMIRGLQKNKRLKVNVVKK